MLAATISWAQVLAELPTLFLFFFSEHGPSETYPLSLHDALPISTFRSRRASRCRSTSASSSGSTSAPTGPSTRSEEHTSELQSHSDLVCRLLLEKKKNRCVSGAQGPAPHLISSLCSGVLIGGPSD